MRRRFAAVLGLLAALLALSVPAGVAAHDFGRAGTVYTMTNAAGAMRSSPMHAPPTAPSARAAPSPPAAPARARGSAPRAR
jgi:hypothetical protein